MFNIFPFQINGILNLDQLWNMTSGLGQAIYSILENTRLDEVPNQYSDRFSNMYETQEIEKSEGDFIELKQNEDGYILIIDLNGIDLRDLSIRYDQGIIEINVKRLEIEKDIFNKILNNTMVKKIYRMQFKDIEDIDTSQLMKIIENRILKIRMPKKYVINEFSNIVDVENYIRK